MSVSIGVLIGHGCWQRFKTGETSYKWICLYITEALAGTIYFVGDNLVSVVTEYTEETNSTILEDTGVDPRIREAQAASVLILMFAALLYLSTLAKDTAKGLKALKENDESHESRAETDDQSNKVMLRQLPLLLMIQHLPKADTLFTIATLSATFTDNDCMVFQNSVYYQGVTWTMWGLLIVILFTTLIVLVLWYTPWNKWKVDTFTNVTTFVFRFMFSSAIISPLFGAFILADNPFPLRCGPSEITEEWIRLGLWVYSFVLLLTAVIILALFWKNYYDEQEIIITNTEDKKTEESKDVPNTEDKKTEESKGVPNTKDKKTEESKV